MGKRGNNSLYVSSEIGRLRRVLVHSPDSGLGKVVPSKAQDWLFEDIVHLDTIRRREYDYFTKILLYFMDPDKIQGRVKAIDAPSASRNFYKPGHADFYRSERVIELQWLLMDILDDYEIRIKLVASVCAIENCSHDTEKLLLSLPAATLANTIITGSVEEGRMLFPPIPNLIFTRDLGIVVKNHILLNKPAKKARIREALLAKYIFYHHAFFAELRSNIIELPNVFHHFLLPKNQNTRKVTFEGGDVMVISAEHLIIGVSERTTMEGAQQAINILFEREIIEKITVVQIPKKRDYMHIDTVFTQVKKDVWVMLGVFSRKMMKEETQDRFQHLLESNKSEKSLKITQFKRGDPGTPKHFFSLEDLLTDISQNELGCKGKVRFVYSGNNEFPFDTREQWTDSCNLLALQEGVVLGYDRNDKTIKAFQENGFAIIGAEQLIYDLEAGRVRPDQLADLLILVPCAELSRARGGFHCMSLPLLRDEPG